MSLRRKDRRESEDREKKDRPARRSPVRRRVFFRGGKAVEVSVPSRETR